VRSILLTIAVWVATAMGTYCCNFLAYFGLLLLISFVTLCLNKGCKSGITLSFILIVSKPTTHDLCLCLNRLHSHLALQLSWSSYFVPIHVGNGKNLPYCRRGIKIPEPTLPVIHDGVIKPPGISTNLLMAHMKPP